MMKRWHIVIAGFLQNEGQDTGMLRLWQRLHREHSSPESVVLLRGWSDSPESQAEMIRLMAANEKERPRINVYGYSWGGMSAVRLCEELGKRGIAVDHLCLCDAVYRPAVVQSRFLFIRRLAAILALSPLRSIVVPANVSFARYVRQSCTWPRGHRVTAKSRSTIVTGRMIGYSHTQIDQSMEWMEVALGAAERISG